MKHSALLYSALATVYLYVLQGDFHINNVAVGQ